MQEESLGYDLQLANRFLEGFVVEDFVPYTYECIYGGHVARREGQYLDAALRAAAANATISLELYPHGWKNKTQNVTQYFTDEVGDLWHYCALGVWGWYDEGIQFYDSFASNET